MRTRASGRVLMVGVMAIAVFVSAREVAHTHSLEEGIFAAYVLFASSPEDNTTPIPFARVIIEPHVDCPVLDFQSGPVTMTPRRNPDVASGRDDFPVTVCEARYVLGEAVHIRDAGIVMPEVTLDPINVVVLGDTGCRGQPNQDCAMKNAWPFPAFAEVIAEERPDLVIHVGDFNYRGTPGTFPAEIDNMIVELNVFDAGDGLPLNFRCQQPNGYASQNMPNSLEPDQWKFWQEDFFAPGKQMLLAAPWVFTRGNHELCSRAGPGWLYFLDPSTDLLPDTPGQLSCPNQESPNPLLYEPPYRLDFDPLTMIVMDTSKACGFTQTPELTKPYVDQFKSLKQLIPDRPTWLVMHRPIWGIQDEKPDQEDSTPPFPGKIEVINRTLQHALRIANGGSHSLPESVELVVSGHMHRFQSLTFKSKRPPQLIIGNSGRELTADIVTDPFFFTVDGAKARGLSMNKFGYLKLLLDRNAEWQGEVFNPTSPQGSQVLAECGTSQLQKGSICKLPDN